MSDTVSELVAEARGVVGALDDVGSSRWARIVERTADLLERTNRERDEAVAREAVLRDDIETYGQHVPYCSCMIEEGASSLPCDCGFRTARTSPSPAAERLLAQVKAADDLEAAFQALVNALRPFAPLAVLEAERALATFRATKEG